MSSVTAFGFSANITPVTKSQFLQMIDNKDTGETTYLIMNPTAQNISFWSKAITNSSKQILLPEDLSLKVTVLNGGYSGAEIYTYDTVVVPTYKMVAGNSTTVITVANLTNFNTTHLRYTDPAIDNNTLFFQPKSGVVSFSVAQNTMTKVKYDWVFDKNITDSKEKLFDPITDSIPAFGNRTLRVKVEPTMGKLSNGGWGYNIDNTLCFASYCYDEYSWYNTSFGYRVNITMNTSWQGTNTDNLTNFPLFVQVNSSIVNYSNMRDDGRDVRFVDSDDTTLLDYEIDWFNKTGNSTFWVRVPTVNANSDTDFIIMYYNCTSCGDAQNAYSLWNTANYAAVWHFNRDAQNVMMPDSLNKTNSTQLGTVMDASNSSFTPTGRGISFLGTSSFNFTNNLTFIAQSVNQTNNLTMESVAYYSGRPIVSGAILEFSQNTQRQQVTSLNSRHRSVLANKTLARTLDDGSGNLSNTWVYLFTAYNATTNAATVRHFSNSTILSTDTSPFNGINVNTTFFGSNGACLAGTVAGACNGLRYNGTLDEIRISNVTRGGEWINATYNTVFRRFNNFSSIEAAPAGGGSALCSGSADCTLACSLGNVSYDQNIGGFNLFFTGTGRVSVNARLYNYKVAQANTGCNVYTTSGGRIG